MVVFESLTMRCKTLALRLSEHAESVYKLEIDQPVLLITPTWSNGTIGRNTNAFLKKYNHLVKGVVVSGDPSYKEDAWKAANHIMKRYPHIEIVRKIEKEGTEEDFEYIKAWYQKHFK